MGFSSFRAVTLYERKYVSELSRLPFIIFKVLKETRRVIEGLVLKIGNLKL